MEDGLYKAVRGLRLAYPGLGVKPILAKLREQQPELGAATKEVRKACGRCRRRLGCEIFAARVPRLAHRRLGSG